MILAIIQARMGSTRLPHKVLKTINCLPLLQYTVHRLSKSKRIDKLVVATSTNPENDQIEQFCITHNIVCFRGSEDDVLDRYYQCARKYLANTIVRITADCPLIDSNIVDDTIDYFFSNKFNLVINTWFHNSFPSGFDVEVFSMYALYTEWMNQTDIAKREHVMNTLSNPRFHAGKFTNLSPKYIDSLNFNINLLHLSVDTPADFALVKRIITHLGPDSRFVDVMNFLNNNIHLVDHNLTPKRRSLMALLKQPSSTSSPNNDPSDDPSNSS